MVPVCLSLSHACLRVWGGAQPATSACARCDDAIRVIPLPCLARNFKLHPSNFTLHTSHFTLHTYMSYRGQRTTLTPASLVVSLRPGLLRGGPWVGRHESL